MNWHGYSIVDSTHLLADQGIADGATHLTQLTGTSCLIVSNERLNEFELSDLEYVDASEVDLTTQTKPLVRRFTSRHFSFHSKQNFYEPIILRLSGELWGIVQRIDPFGELVPLKQTLGSQWYSVKRETCVKAILLLASDPRIEKYFRKIRCSDESLFGIILHQVSPDTLKFHLIP